MPENNNLYNNADSFATIFDEAWKKTQFKAEDRLTNEQKIIRIIENNKDHPFVKNHPDQALNVAKFRLRLLQLE